MTGLRHVDNIIQFVRHETKPRLPVLWLILWAIFLSHGGNQFSASGLPRSHACAVTAVLADESGKEIEHFLQSDKKREFDEYC